MARGRSIVVLGLLGLLTLQACASHDPPGRSRAPADDPGTPGADAALERAVHEQVNRHRRAHGLVPLTLDARITRQARLHSAAMADGRTRFGHDGFGDRVKALREAMPCPRTAENVASNRGHRDPGAQAVRGWLDSPAHRENIEGPYELTGVGVARSARGEVFFTQMFVGR